MEKTYGSAAIERELAISEHDSSANVQLKKAGLYTWDSDNLQWVRFSGGSYGKALLVGGNGTVAEAGTAVQLSVTSVECKKVIIQNHESNGNLTNGGAIVIGDSNVVAASDGRKGHLLYPTQSLSIEVNNLNKIWIDSVDDAAKFHFIFEN